MLAPHGLPCVELSALRMDEVVPLLDALGSLDLSGYERISFHAPGQFERKDEAQLAELLHKRIPKTWPIVMHPDAIFDYGCWRRFGPQLAIENMDRRKPIGRNVAELQTVFAELPEAQLCFDIGHARQYDPSMTEAFLILKVFRSRLVQVHASEVNSESQHDQISYGAKLAFQQVAEMIGDAVPIIVESRVAEAAIPTEIANVVESLSVEAGRSKPEEMRRIFDGLGSLMTSLSGIGSKAV
jgi:hypothetical protein